MRVMLRTRLDALIADVLSERRLLDHPFYRRWEAGTLAKRELAAYAGQYRHFERALPEILERVVDGLAEGPVRQLVQANLDDERAVPAPHVALFEDFASAVGAPLAVGATRATSELIASYHRASQDGPAAALASLAVYEVQAPAVALSKAEGLRAHYGLDAAGTRFWDVHAHMDELHAQWALDAVAALAHAPADVAGAARDAADAWWAFLEDREAEAPLAATG